MKTYRITSSAGADLGVFEGASPEEAILAMHRDAGYGAGAVRIEGDKLVAGEEWDDAFGPVDIRDEGGLVTISPEDDSTHEGERLCPS